MRSRNEDDLDAPTRDALRAGGFVDINVDVNVVGPSITAQSAALRAKAATLEAMARDDGLRQCSAIIIDNDVMVLIVQWYRATPGDLKHPEEAPPRLPRDQQPA